MKINPIKEWLARVATECGSPGEMMAQAMELKHANTRRLVLQYAEVWQKRQIAKVVTLNV